MNSLELEIEGMHCGGCVRRVTGVLAAVPGLEVKDVKVGAACLTLDHARATPEAVIHVLKSAGYTARLAGRPEGSHVGR